MTTRSTDAAGKERSHWTASKQARRQGATVGEGMTNVTLPPGSDSFSWRAHQETVATVEARLRQTVSAVAATVTWLELSP